MTDIWSNEEVIPAESADVDNGEGVVLDLSGEEFGDDYPTIPVNTHVRVTVFDAEHGESKNGNEMYTLKLRTVGDEWGKNRMFRFFVTLTPKALAFTLPSLSALGKPATFNGEPVRTKRMLAQAHKAANGKGNLSFPSVEDLLGIEVFAKVTEHNEGEPDEDGHVQIFERIGKLVSADDPKASMTAVTPTEGNAVFAKDNPYKG